MGRRGSQTSGLEALFVVVFVIGGIAWLATQAVAHWNLTAPALLALILLLYVRQKRHAQASARAQQAALDAYQAKRRAWRQTTFEPGSFSVVVTGFTEKEIEQELATFLSDLPELRDQPGTAVQELLERVLHVAAQPVAEAIAQRDAVRVKVALEERGARVKIVEGAARRSSNGREPIAAQVRREVWRRDGGQCVDCGSRERLEYDHIVPVSRGGANTARNLELRCEVCNRRKGARV